FLEKMPCSIGPLLPDSHKVAGRIAERGHPQISFHVWFSDDLAAVILNPLYDIIDVIDIDVRQQPRLARDLPARDPSADQLTAPVIKAQLPRLCLVNLPAQNRLIKVGGLFDIDRRNFQIGQMPMTGQARLDTHPFPLSKNLVKLEGIAQL